MRIVMKEVTQPVHGADGTVTHRPGQQFPQAEALPEGVPWRWVIAEAPDPAPALADADEDGKPQTPAQRRRSLKEMLEDPPPGS